MDAKDRDALDLLEDEDRELDRLFDELKQNRGPAVEERATYGDVTKELIRVVARREAALTEVARAIEGVSELRTIEERLETDRELRRPLIDRVETLSRGVPGISLNTGQDMDGPLQELVGVVSTEIDFDMTELFPAVREWFQTEGNRDLPSADRVAKHAPTNLSPAGPRWYERAPVISRLMTLYDHLRDYPGAVRQR